MAKQWDPFTPCDDSLENIPHRGHSYDWAGVEYICRGWPGLHHVGRPDRQCRHKEKFHHRLMDWLVDLEPVEFYALMGAGIFSALVLFFTVVWTWVMF